MTFTILLSACNKEQPYLIFNSSPITQKTVYDAQKVFQPNQTIYYAILMPKGFKHEYLKMQIIKKPDNIPHGGLTVQMASNLFVDTDKKFYIDKFVLREEGTYFVRFFYANAPYEAFVDNVIWVRY